MTTTLRPLSLTDAPGLLGVIDRNRTYFRCYLSWLDSVTSLVDVQTFISDNIALAANGKAYFCPILDRQTPIGLVGFNRINRIHQSGEISYWLDAAYHGQGIVTHACREIIEYGWNQLNLHRIELLINTDNLASCAVANRLGFRLEGMHRGSFRMYDRYVDQFCYVLLESDWRALADDIPNVHPS